MKINKYTNRNIVILFLCLIPVFAEAQWQEINTGFSNYFWDVKFTSPYTGFLCGEGGLIIKSTNGGQNWYSVTPFTNTTYYSMCFLDDNTGWVAGGYYQIFKTTNGGTNWIGYSTPTGNGLLRVQFINGNTGYACGYTNAFLKSTNGGVNWVNFNSVNQTINTCMYFANLDTGYLVSYTPGTPVEWYSLARTYNGGSNWIGVFATASEKIRDIFFSDPEHGFASGESNKIFTSSNYGTNWNEHPLSGQNQGLYFYNYLTGYVCNFAGQIFRTTNGCASFNLQATSTSGGLKRIFFYDYYNGYCVGSSGKLLKTTNGGSVFVSNISNEVPDKFELGQNYPNPFNQSTIFNLQCSMKSNVSIKLFDAAGREVRTLVNETLAPGTYQVRFDGSGLASGMYYYSMTVDGKQTAVKKMVMIK